jgi:hypothetical protein
MTTKMFLSGILASGCLAATGLVSVASADAYEFATQDTCQYLACDAKSSGYTSPVPSGSTAWDFAMTDLTPVKIKPVAQTEIAAMEADRGSSHTRLPEGSTIYDWVTEN